MKLLWVTVALLWSGSAWAQSEEIDRLARIVHEQSREIDELKAQIARIEQVLSIGSGQQPPVTPAVFVAPASNTQTAPPQSPQPPASQILEQQKAVVAQALAGKWYERISIRGYTQFRYSNVLSEEGAPLEIPADRSVNPNETLLIRRGRFVFSGDISNHLSLYAQSDFNGSTGAPDFSLQMRDLYADIFLDSQKEFRFRLGQSKVPFGWSNMQSSSNRAPFERPDAINSAADGERDYGAYFMWASSEARQRFRDLAPLKGTGDYGVVALGAYAGQGPNRSDQNGLVHVVGRVSYPFKTAGGKFFELGLQAYHGKFVTPVQAFTTGGASITPAQPSRGVIDQRVGVTAVWYPQPVGIETEWNIGRGPELSADLRTIESRFLNGGYVQLNYRRAPQGSTTLVFPFARWNYYDGGRKFARNAPNSRVNELDLGLEFAPWPELEITPLYTRTFRRTRTSTFPYEITRNANRVGFQVQWNY
jgi:hypothetical protein